MPDKSDLLDAAARIKTFIHKTPVLTSQTLNELIGCELFFKCENFQKVGAFKFRGAINTINQLTDDQLKNGVATHSSGNHAQALALAAKRKGVKAYIVMPNNAPKSISGFISDKSDIPNNAPKSKKEAVIGYGANVIECEPTLEARETTLNSVVEETSAYFIHPYNDERIIAGQSTCAQELIEDFPGLDFILAPVGGGGLLSGTALATHFFSPRSMPLPRPGSTRRTSISLKR